MSTRGLAMATAQCAVAALLAILVTGCTPGLYEYLDQPTSASDAELQAAWDAEFPPGTTRADLLAHFPLAQLRAPGFMDFSGLFIYTDYDGEFTVHSQASPFYYVDVITVEISFDSDDRIVKSTVHAYTYSV